MPWYVLITKVFEQKKCTVFDAYFIQWLYSLFHTCLLSYLHSKIQPKFRKSNSDSFKVKTCYIEIYMTWICSHHYLWKIVKEVFKSMQFPRVQNFCNFKMKYFHLYRKCFLINFRWQFSNVWMKGDITHA